MKAFRCRVCGAQLFFENSVCVSCGTALGYSREEHDIVPLNQSGQYVDSDGMIWHICRNLNLSGCTWLARIKGEQCDSCALTRVRPNDADLEGLENFVPAERAQRQLVVEIDRLGLPLRSRVDDPEEGLCFDLLSSVSQSVTIGHADGVITIDLAESDDAYRERVRDRLDEPYRTMLGHFRHEVGHYYQWQLVRSDDEAARFRALFGDERADYQAAIDEHYANGAPAGWRQSYISQYATMHPHEDFAETWAHYLHIRDTIDTAVSFGLISEPPADQRFREQVVNVWMPLTAALNGVNRSMGKEDLYPFVIASDVLDKLDYVAELVGANTAR
ncbi:zinc-binding metallopeptidase family protein [Microbacterium marmarense]|uniref:Zinc-binding metallopeptidase n=1 Tax=Microbacterium marmarense TaxID=3122051 RepID=A0ABU8LPY6_9MICO